MATGIPNITSHKNKKHNSNNFCLQYEVKASREEILRTQQAQLRCVISVDKQPINRLIFGENLRVISNLLNENTVAGKVKLIYIDPPYATGSSFESRKRNHAYHDLMESAEYLEFIRQRLILLRELLSEEGSIYIHLDENMAFPVKIIMDEVFGYNNFRNWITRKKSRYDKTNHPRFIQ